MLALAFDAYVGGALCDRTGSVWFALGDGRVCCDAGSTHHAHRGAILCVGVHPSGEGVLTGGEDGRVVWTRPSGMTVLYERPGRWIDAMSTSAVSGLWALASGRDVEVRDTADASFARTFRHERPVAALAFDAKGRRLAAGTYGGVVIWYARIAEQKPQMLKWAGSHIEVAWSPDDRFLISAMQENALHGWRLADGRDMRMGGYPAKVRSLTFLAKGRAMATSGGPGAVVWPFAGADGPMGKSAVELDPAEDLVTRVAAASAGHWVAMGRSDGSVRLADLTSGLARTVVEASGAAISALAASADGLRVAYGTETGSAGVVVL